MNRAPILLVTAAMAASLAACSTDKEGYPSLARRPAEQISGADRVCPVERITGIAEPVTPAPPPPQVSVPPSPDLMNRLAGLVDQARSAHSRFGAERGRTEALVSAGAGTPVASESWSIASVALAGLESARSDAMVALADLDQLYAATRIEGGDSTAIAAARDQVDAWVAEEDRVLTDLKERFGN